MARGEGKHDLVIPVKYSGYNDELRYAIRSMDHLPYRGLVISGYCPAWVVPDYFLPFRQDAGSKYLNTTQIMRLACGDPNISDPFIWSNDDIFAINVMDRLPLFNRGPVIDQIAKYTAKGSQVYVKGMQETYEMMLSHELEGPLMSYELHMPMLIDKEAMLEVLALAENGPKVFHKRTFYGNWMALGGITVPDSKIYRPDQNWSTRFPFVSTSDESFRSYYVGQWLREKFPESHVCEVGKRFAVSYQVKPGTGQPIDGPVQEPEIILNESE